MNGRQDGDYRRCKLACEGDACEIIHNNWKRHFKGEVLLQVEMDCENHVGASGEVQSAKTPLDWTNKNVSPALPTHWS
jgi:hypothetical protein